MWVRAPLTVSVCQCQPLPTLLHASVIHASCLRQLDWGNLPASVTVSTRCFTHTYASILTAVSAAATTRRTHPAGPWPAEATQVLPPGYVALAESCWARQRTKRPSAQEVLRELLSMLAQVEGEGGTQAEAEGGGQAEQQQQQQHRE